MGTPKEHIESIRRSREQNDRNSTSFTNTLLSNIHTAFKGENKFILELLQNADDAAVIGKETSIHILHINEYLVFVHNGRPFTQSDVEKICDNAQDQYTDKSEGANQTGYKGIGFKSIFSIAKRVHIKSGEYSFRFDEEHFAGKNNLQGKYPWPVIPLWTEISEIPNDIRQELSKLKDVTNETTLFILSLRDNQDIESQVEFFKNEPTNVLFLRNINSISFSSQKSQWTISRRITENQHARIFLNDAAHSEWLLNQFTFNIPSGIKLSLQNLKSFECPERLKTTSSTTLTFAVKLKNSKLDIVNPSKLFCYLPTQVRSDIPALINGDFLLNVERTQLVQNSWNEFLIKQVAGCLFSLMAKLTKDPSYRQQILSLFPPAKLEYLPPWCDTAYKIGFQHAQSNIAFLPSQFDANVLLKLPQAIYDETSFSVIFPEVARDINLIERSVEHHEKIIPYIKKVIRLEDVLAQITTRISSLEVYKTYEFQVRILDFIAKLTLLPQHINLLITGAKLLDSQGQLQPVKQLYLKIDDTALPVEANIKFVDQRLYYNSRLIYNLLLTLGIKNLDPIVFIRDHLIKKIANNEISETEQLNVHIFLRHHHGSFLVESPEWQVIKKLPVWISPAIKTENHFTQYGSSNIDKCYLPLNNSPILDSQRAIYLHPVYALQTSVNNDPHDLQKWYEYFKKLGIVDKITLRVLPRVKISELKRMLPRLADEYFKYLKAKTPISSEDIEIINFPYIEYLDFISDENYINTILWPALILNTETLSKTNTTVNGAVVDNIIQFLFKMYNILKSSSGSYKSGDLHYRKIKNEFHPYFKIAQTPNDVTEQLALHLGIKTSIDISDCLELLSRISSGEEIQDIKFHELVFSRILTLEPALNRSERALVKSWQGRLPAHDGTLQDKTKIFHYAVSSVAICPSPYWLMQMQLANGQMKKIAELFGIRALTDYDIEFEHMSALADDDQIKNKIIQRCCYIAAIYAKETNQTYENCFQQFDKIITNISIKVSNGIFLTLKNPPANTNKIKLQNVFAYKNQNTLYIDGSLGISSSTIGNIAEFLGEKLSIKDKAKNTYVLLSSIIELEHDRLLNYLARAGYTEDFLKRFTRLGNNEVILASLNQPLSNINPVNTITAYMPPPIQSNDAALLTQMNSMRIEERAQTVAEFIPAVQANQVSVSGIQIEKFVHKSTGNTGIAPPSFNMNASTAVGISKPPSQHAPNFTAKEQQDLAAIGKWAEYFVFRCLHAYYQKKFPTSKIEETQDGFTFQASNKKQGLIQYRIIWHNKQNESFGPRDLTLVKGQHERVIEVKGTVNNSGIVHISANEWTTMVQYQKQYRLYRVSNVGQSDPHVTMIKDPVQAIKSGQFPINKIELKF